VTFKKDRKSLSLAPIKGLFILLAVSTMVGQEKADEADLKMKETGCKGEMIEKASKNGIRSLSLTELFRYYREIKKCPDKKMAKAIKKANDERQFKEDAENYKGFTGWTSSCAYCAIALFVYSIFQ
jgi:radical SAM superfamily enzyme YgiQ (UPF0313 family)|tara:strand:- start:1786 stop:2163 length:378 start_codon:yes stop_codon:yes gene_type:complete